MKRYEELRDSYNQKYSEHLATHKKTETQEKNWVSWDEYLGMVEKLKDSVQDLRKKKEWDKGDTLRYQNYLLSLLYSNYPLRNDFHDMEVITQRDFKKRSDNKNYFVIQTSKKPKYKIVLNEYKTSAKYKQQVILIDDPILTKAIDTWLSRRSTAGSAFIVSPSSTDLARPISSNELTKVLISLSSQWLDGKRVGSSLLRHIYLSDKYSDTLKEQGDDAKLMMHSKSMQEGYIKSDWCVVSAWLFCRVVQTYWNWILVSEIDIVTTTTNDGDSDEVHDTQCTSTEHFGATGDFGGNVTGFRHRKSQKFSDLYHTCLSIDAE